MKTTIYLLALISLLSGCTVSTTTSTKPNSNNTPASTEPKSADASTDKEPVLNALKKLREVQAVTVKTVRANGDAAIIEQFSASDSSYSRKAEDGESIETVIVGPETFSRMNSAWEWKKEADADPKSSASYTFSFPINWLIRLMSGMNLQTVASEDLNGKPTTLYTLTASKETTDLPKSLKIWIGKDNGLPLKMESESDEGANTTTYDFDSKVKIVRPVVKK